MSCKVESQDKFGHCIIPSQTLDSTDTINDDEQNTNESRFSTPTNYQRIKVADHSFADYLRKRPLKGKGAHVQYYNGMNKPNNHIYEAVLDQEIGNKDLHQCADAIIRLRADYFWQNQAYDSIKFDLTNGDNIAYRPWREGKRVVVTSNKTKWIQKREPNEDYATFWSYLEFIFTYAGTASLEKELMAIPISSMKIGDVFIQGGFPGHAVMVLDMAIHEETKGKVYMLGQSYMPAQEFQVLVNPNDRSMSPWYHLTLDEQIITPEWTFSQGDLRRWK